MAQLEHILHFLEDLFSVHDFPDYDQALNGLQVQGPGEVQHLVAAVDACEATIQDAVERGAQLLLVHHGLFWDGLRPFTGARYRKVAALIRGGVGLYSLHLPLDAHPEHGNSAVLMRRMGLEPEGRFGPFQGVDIGWWASTDVPRDELKGSLGEAVGGEARLIPGGPKEVKRVGVITGAGASAMEEAASLGLDSLITGEAPHHAYHQAMELGINLFLGGHYGTETFGVISLAETVAAEFGIDWEFVDHPTGL